LRRRFGMVDKSMAARSCHGSLLAFVVLGLTFLPVWGCTEKQKAEAPPPEVQVVDVIQKDVPIYREWVGTMDGLVNATIRAQVSGYLIKQNYREGDLVKKGQVLFEIDARPFEAALAQAKGELARQEAGHENAKLTLARVKPLAEQNALSKKDLDDATSRELATQASVLAARAAVQKAELDLEFTRITSPLDGIAGIAKAQLGNLVGPGFAEELTTVSTVDPIKVYIQLSEQQYLKTRGTMTEREAHARGLPLQLILSDATVYPYEGQFSLADRQVDVTTGTIKVASLFPNPGNMLRPGQFGRVRAQTEVKKGALLVPQRAVTEMQGRYLVAAVGDDNKVGIRPVKVAEKVGSQWIIEEGLKPGDRIVAEGIQKVKEGLTVNPKPFVEEAEKKQEAPSKPEAPQKPEKR
jgi:membrane fusion protein (multidrug efflux system)